VPGFLAIATLLTGLAALGVSRISGRNTVITLIGAALVAVAAVVGSNHVITVIGVWAFAVILGILVGRWIPASAPPLASVLVVLSVADIVWIVSGGGTGPEWAGELLNVSISIGSGTSTIGAVDLILAAAIAIHWVRRDESQVLAVLAAPMGMIISNLFTAVTGTENLALVPFITAGWLLTETWHRLRSSNRQEPESVTS
jgi:hypothetical protein